MTPAQYGELVYNQEWLKNNRMHLICPPPPGSGFNGDSILLYYQHGEFVAECGSFEGAISFARGYLKAREKFEYHPAPNQEGVVRSYIARHESELGFATKKALKAWIASQDYPENYCVAVMEYKP